MKAILSNAIEDRKYNYKMTLVATKQTRIQSSLFKFTYIIQLGVQIKESIPIHTSLIFAGPHMYIKRTAEFKKT